MPSPANVHALPSAEDGAPCDVMIEGDGDLARVVDELEDALVVAGAPIYVRAGELVRVIDGESPRRGLERDPAAPLIVPHTDVTLQITATEHVAIHKRNRKTKNVERVDCPLALARALREKKVWSFRELAGVVEHPIVLPDGRVLWTSDYDQATGLLFHAPPYAYESPIDKPTRHDAEIELQRLRDLLAEFPFVEPVDESVAIAFVLTFFVRPVVPTAPAFLVNATAAGTGKSYLVRLPSILASGREPALMTLADDPAELKKVLFAALLQGDEHIALDNAVGVVDSAALCALLTAPVYQDRLLGASRTVRLPTSAVVTINGNNLIAAGDLTRRVLEVRLDAQCERPAERRFDLDPIEEVRAQRGDYVLSCITILQAYAMAGERVDVAPFGSFNEWSRMVREPLIWLGMPDPCASQRHLEDEDPERTALQAMLSAVGSVFGVDEWSVGDLIAAADSRRQAELVAGHVVDADARVALEVALQQVCERNGELNARACGRWLRRVSGRVIGGSRFVKARESNVGAYWRRQAVG